MSQQINLYNPLFLRREKYFSAKTMLQALGLMRDDRRIIEIEKEGLVLMSEALEAVGPRIARVLGQGVRRHGELGEGREEALGERLSALVPEELPGAEVLDFGCGTGRGALMLALLGGLRVTMLDFVNNCLDEEVRAMLTTQAHALRFLKLHQPTQPHRVLGDAAQVAPRCGAPHRPIAEQRSRSKLVA